MINEITNFLKEKTKMHILSLIITSIIIFEPYNIFYRVFKEQIPSSIKILCAILFLTSLIVLVYNFVEYLIKSKWGKKKRSEEYLRLLKNFKDDKIAQKFTKICIWQRKNHNKGEYIKQHNNPKEHPKFQQMHDDRRNVTEYYQEINKSYDDKLITSEEVYLLIPKNRIEIMLNIFEPIEKDLKEITNSNYNQEVFKFLGRVYRKELK